MSSDNPYDGLREDNDPRWAFGSGAVESVSNVDSPVPSGVDGAALAGYCLMLGDDALVMSHRLQEWCTRGPELEDEVALANIGLDLLGQARLLYARAGVADGSGRGEDDFAFQRGEREFRNVRLVESDEGHFGHVIARLLVFSTWRLAVFSRLVDCADPVVAAIAAKGVKELTYHRDYAAQWAVRLGDGTELSHERMQEALEHTWAWVDELFTGSAEDTAVGVAPATVRAEFDEVLGQVLAAATLDTPQIPQVGAVSGRLGRDGAHTERMGFLLADLQSVARAYPGATW